MMPRTASSVEASIKRWFIHLDKVANYVIRLDYNYIAHVELNYKLLAYLL